MHKWAWVLVHHSRYSKNASTPNYHASGRLWGYRGGTNGLLHGSFLIRSHFYKINKKVSKRYRRWEYVNPYPQFFHISRKTPPLDEGRRGRHILLPFLHLLNTILEHVGTSNKPSTIVLHVPWSIVTWHELKLESMFWLQTLI